jgi:hypothetical protein
MDFRESRFFNLGRGFGMTPIYRATVQKKLMRIKEIKGILLQSEITQKPFGQTRSALSKSGLTQFINRSLNIL